MTNVWRPQMTKELEKGQTISLEGESGTGLRRVGLGLGWEAADKGAFAGASSQNSVDLDVSCAMFDRHRNILDLIWYQQLVSEDGSIVHTGDNRSGEKEGAGDDEQIIIDLTRVPASVTSLLFAVTSFHGQKFDEVENAYCRLEDKAGDREVARYWLKSGGRHQAQIVARIYRHGDGWKMHAIGAPVNGRTLEDLIPAVAEFL